MRRQLIIAGFTVLACGLLLGAVICAGKLARNALRHDERYQIAFSQIESPTPPGMEREAFLAEVRYYTELPETISVFDNALPAQLSDAFARHPWVERVDGIDAGPNRRVRVRLTFRTPVLAVVTADGPRRVRAVDRSGILLPRGADTLLLPHLSGSAPSPAGIGKPWGDPQVESAANIAGFLQLYQSTLQLNDFRWSDGLLRLRRDSATLVPDVIWGRSPGDEAPGEADAPTKLRRLLAGAAKLRDATGPAVVDLRRE